MDRPAAGCRMLEELGLGVILARRWGCVCVGGGGALFMGRGRIIMPRCLDSGTGALFQLGWSCDQGTKQGEGEAGKEEKEDAEKGPRMPLGVLARTRTVPGLTIITSRVDPQR